MTIEDRVRRCFLGVAVMDSVVRLATSAAETRRNLLIETHKFRQTEAIGDAEWGFFVDPRFRRCGIALQAMYALTGALSTRRSWCALDVCVVQRVWASTGSDNLETRSLLEKIGFIAVDSKLIGWSESPRFHSDGTPIALIHYDQPEHDLNQAITPANLLIKRLESTNAVAQGWHLTDSKT